MPCNALHRVDIVLESEAHATTGPLASSWAQHKSQRRTVISRSTRTSCFWPMRCARAIACALAAMPQSGES
eukprot:6212898-Pleurochrysis_carterae.AAC.8